MYMDYGNILCKQLLRGQLYTTMFTSIHSDKDGIKDTKT